MSAPKDLIWTSDFSLAAAEIFGSAVGADEQLREVELRIALLVFPQPAGTLVVRTVNRELIAIDYAARSTTILLTRITRVVYVSDSYVIGTSWT